MNRITRTLALVAFAGLGLGATAYTTPAQAREVVVVTTRVAPPPPRIERVPSPRVGYVWAPGYWRWNGARHVWVGGYWVRERPGYRWAPARWEHRGPGWYYNRGGWVR